MILRQETAVGMVRRIVISKPGFLCFVDYVFPGRAEEFKPGASVTRKVTKQHLRLT